jgi:hypothetical protein
VNKHCTHADDFRCFLGRGKLPLNDVSGSPEDRFIDGAND